MDDFRVDTDIEPGLEAVTRFQSIRRWHMVDTTRSQSIAEHSANVALLAYHIAIYAPEGYFGSAAGVLAPAMFLPLRFVHPVRTKRWRGVTLPVALIWLGSAAAAAWQGFYAGDLVQAALVGSSLYLLGVGLVQQGLDRLG